MGSSMDSAMDSDSSMNMSMPMAMEVDRRTVGGRMMGTFLFSDFELRSGADTQLSTHRNKIDDRWNKDARFHDYGLFSELTWSVTEQNKVKGALVSIAFWLIITLMWVQQNGLIHYRPVFFASNIIWLTYRLCFMQV